MISEAAWLVPLLPALSGLAIVFFGKQFPRKGAEIGITAISLSLLLSVLISVEVFGHNVDAVAQVEAAHGEGPAEEGGEEAGEEEHALAGVRVASVGGLSGLVADTEAAGGEVEEPGEAVAIPEGVSEFRLERSTPLAPNGSGLDIEAGIRVDGLTAMMFLLVTIVSLMVQVYSTSYMHGDPRYTWYFALLSFFTASMLLLVISNNMLQLLVGWELVGVCSFLLIGFWWEEKKNQDAAIKAFLTTRFGDLGLLVGVVSLWGEFGTFNITRITETVAAGEFNQGRLTFALLMLFMGCVGKSAQFPLHTWLPDAMAGPTPVSALIHAATMVTAGVFLIARLYPVFHASPTAVTVIAVIGAITLFVCGLLATVQDDVKRVLAYSTVSQLGYMVAALAFSYTAGIFHLFTHGFFKALLFLGSGSLIHAVHSNNMSDMGGLRKVMPVTFWTFLAGSAALAALPPLAGFWSKDEILAGAFEAGGFNGNLVLGLGVLGGMVTAFYMTRTLYLVFAGEYRGHGHPHESPPAMRWPLIILAVPALLVGLTNLPFGRLHGIGFAAWTMFDLEYFESHPARFVVPVAIASVALATIGILIGRSIYSRRRERDPMLQLGLVTQVLENKYYLDHLYTDLIVRPLRTRVAAAAYWFNDNVLDRIVYAAGAATSAFGRFTYTSIDQRGIDGAVNGVGASASGLGAVFRLAQSGNVQLYAGAMFVGVFVLGVLFAFAS